MVSLHTHNCEPEWDLKDAGIHTTHSYPVTLLLSSTRISQLLLHQFPNTSSTSSVLAGDPPTSNGKHQKIMLISPYTIIPPVSICRHMFCFWPCGEETARYLLHVQFSRQAPNFSTRSDPPLPTQKHPTMLLPALLDHFYQYTNMPTFSHLKSLPLMPLSPAVCNYSPPILFNQLQSGFRSHQAVLDMVTSGLHVPNSNDQFILSYLI